MENFFAGGFSAFRLITPDEKKLFEDVIQSLIGVGYQPLAVAAQVVAGTNYAFFCEAKVVAPNTLSYNVLVVIHQPLPGVNEPPSLMEIKTVKII